MEHDRGNGLRSNVQKTTAPLISERVAAMPVIVEMLERLTWQGPADFLPRRGYPHARVAVALLIMGYPDDALIEALDAMAKDPRWWDLAVEIGQWCA